MTLPLPEPRPLRCTIRNKAAILEALREGRLSRDDACARYELSSAELDQWLMGFAELGRNGLKLTRRQGLRLRPRRRRGPLLSASAGPGMEFPVRAER